MNVKSCQTNPRVALPSVHHWSGKLGILLLLALAAWATMGNAANPIQFNRDIRPILAENCFQCHGPDSAARKADLRLDQRADAVKSGAIKPGKPGESEALARVFTDDADTLMPPPASRKQLTAAQKELLQRWVAEGAEYQPHWSFLTPQRPPLPAVRREEWVRNPIDSFILAKLEEIGLEPAPEADRPTLARRLSLDITGLPPTPELVATFVQDQRPDAYERLVDRLLALPQWGEHRARYWLDAARYADTHGIHFDNFREMWTYRDWVINAFNRNLPFDQFTVEQLAGDLLPEPTLDQRVATGFNRCNMTTNEGGVIAEEYLVLYTRDRVETTAQVWLGLTAGCAVCHNHKFDPLSQQEFYEMAAFFNNTTQGAMDGNIRDTPPVVFVPQPSDRPRWHAIDAEIATAKRQTEERRQAAKTDFQRWISQVKPTDVIAQLPKDPMLLHAPLSEGKQQPSRARVSGAERDLRPSGELRWTAGHVAAEAVLEPAGLIALTDAGDLEREQPFSCGAWVKIDDLNQSGPIVARMDEGNGFRGWDLWFENGKVGTHLVSQWQADAIKVVSRQPLRAGQWQHVMVTYDGSSRAAGVRVYIDGAQQDVEVTADSLRGSIRAMVPFYVGQRHQTQKLRAAIQDVRLYGRALRPDETRQLALATRAGWLATKPAAQRSPAEVEELFNWWLASNDTLYKTALDKVTNLENERKTIQGRGTIGHVMQEKSEPAMAYILYRGEYDKRRDAVKPSTPAALPPLPPDFPRNRLGFARWLLMPEHPLTARVTVNRFWQEVFGTGIVRTSGDFGITGELPSHPELLDWLAVEFRTRKWDVKDFFRLMVTSATYRQAALTTPVKAERDSQNRLLSRGPRFRLDGESIRDQALAISGLLVPTLGGPSVKPYQPDGVWEAVAMDVSNTRQYQRDRGANIYRRSLYTFWKRAAPPASLEIFNAPSREFCTVRRDRTNTPMQALVTLNDPQFVEAARVLAQRTLKEGGATDEQRFVYLGQRLLGRTWRGAEIPVLKTSLAEFLTYYTSSEKEARDLLSVGDAPVDANLPPARLAAWTMLANQLLNLDEVLNK